MPKPEQKLLPAVDTPPASGVFVDHDEVELDIDEVLDGNALGDMIEIEDDEDNGLGT